MTKIVLIKWTLRAVDDFDNHHIDIQWLIDISSVESTTAK